MDNYTRKPITLNISPKEAKDLWQGLESVIAKNIARWPEDRARHEELVAKIKADHEKPFVSEWPAEPGQDNVPSVDYAHVARLIMVSQEYPWVSELKNHGHITHSEE